MAERKKGHPDHQAQRATYRDEQKSARRTGTLRDVRRANDLSRVSTQWAQRFFQCSDLLSQDQDLPID